MNPSHICFVCGVFSLEWKCLDGIAPYLLIDKGCPLLDWVAIFHKQRYKLLLNIKHKKGSVVMENAFLHSKIGFP